MTVVFSSEPSARPGRHSVVGGLDVDDSKTMRYVLKRVIINMFYLDDTDREHRPLKLHGAVGLRETLPPAKKK